MQVQTIQVGDKVRSYDFPESPNRGQSYITGTVVGFTDLECTRYVIELESRFYMGETFAAAGEVVPPVNGTPRLFGGVCDGVEKI